MKQQIKDELKKSLEKLGIDTNVEILVEKTKTKVNGDYASNIALKLSKQVEKSPMELAKMIIDNIDKNLFVKVEAAMPGFLNFFVKNDYLFDNIKTVIKQGNMYGHSEIGKNIKINLEYVSANPTGILHLGHARGAAFGDSLARILSFASYDVTREYYINDAGNQMNNLGQSIKTRYRNLCGIEEELGDNCYHGPEIIEIAKKIYLEEKDACIDQDINYFKKYGLNILLDQIKRDLKDFNVSFDVWSSEEAIYKSGAVNETLEKLKASNNTYEQDGAVFLKTTLYGDEKDRVLVKQDGNNTYLLPDIAYHSDKYNRSYDLLIDILGADHHGYIPRLKASMEILGYDSKKLDVMILQMVRLLRNNQEIKMSKRTGNAVTISELIKEVGTDVARYFFVAHSLDTQMDFDLDLAIKKSNENPIYYINYAHARICSILNEYPSLDVDSITNFLTITSDSAYNVLEKVYQFRETVENAARRKEVHIITNYAYDLASLFHTYYAKEKIVTDDFEYTNEHLAFIKAVQITLQNALSLIGVKAYEKM